MVRELTDAAHARTHRTLYKAARPFYSGRLKAERAL